MKTFTYSNPLMPIRPVMFVWVAQEKDAADEAFEEVIGTHPSKIFGIRCVEREVSKELREARLVK